MFPYVVVTFVVGGLGVTPGVRHRHEDGDTAHSHSQTSDHFDQHLSVVASRLEPTAERTGRNDSESDMSGSSHLHIAFFGISLTLHDDTTDSAAPTVAARRTESASETANRPEVVEIADLMGIEWVTVGMVPILLSAGHVASLTVNASLDTVVFREPAPMSAQDRPPIPPPRAMNCS